MTLAELHERIGWQLEGKLEWKDDDGDWLCIDQEDVLPGIADNAASYRRTPDAPPMPDEVWLRTIGTADGEPWSRREARPSREVIEAEGCEATRYVRADGVIDGSRLEGRHKDSNKGAWLALSCCEYRFTP